jgi:hypothetical protein
MKKVINKRDADWFEQFHYYAICCYKDANTTTGMICDIIEQFVGIPYNRELTPHDVQGEIMEGAAKHYPLKKVLDNMNLKIEKEEEEKRLEQFYNFLILREWEFPKHYKNRGR